jgi:hypothetical protein
LPQAARAPRRISALRLRPQADLNALVVIANPSDLENYRLAKVDVEGELSRAKEAMAKIEVKPIASGGAATLNNIAEQLRDGYDILFMRLRSGRIWYVPGFGDDPKGFQKWPAIQRYTQCGKCTPIIGGGVVEGLFGSMTTIARRWAETFNFPMEPYNRDDLPSVAQYLAVDQSSTAFPRDTLMDYLGRAWWNATEATCRPISRISLWPGRWRRWERSCAPATLPSLIARWPASRFRSTSQPTPTICWSRPCRRRDGTPSRISAVGTATCWIMKASPRF